MESRESARESMREATESLAKTVESDTKVFGFWVYLMTDLVVFSVLFACFLVLRGQTFGGPTGRELFNMETALAETLILLTSSFTCSLGMIAVYNQAKGWAAIWFLLTFGLGVAFLYLELSEFARFVGEGNSWQRNAFLSSFFTLVGTHGFHIFSGLIWMAVVLLRLAIRPLNGPSISRIARMSLFWHFLDYVWIFIFTIVYGLEALS